MMLRNFSHRRQRSARGGAFFLLAAVCLGCMLANRGAAQESILYVERDGYAVTAGAPTPEGSIRTLSRRTLLQGTLLLVSPRHPLPQDFPLPNTRAIRSMVGSYLPALEGVALWQEAIYSLCEMQAVHPLEAGVTLCQGTLSPAQQEDARREAFSRYLAVYPLAEALERAQAAVPGGNESEHQTGYALDLEMTGILQASRVDPILRNETGEWLEGNMWRYGWIHRYQPGSGGEGACEHVHLRYVGKVHAAAMHVLNVDLEAYLALLEEQGTLTIFREQQPWAYLYALPCPGDLEFALPAQAAYQASLDNLGNAILAVAAQGAF